MSVNHETLAAVEAALQTIDEGGDFSQVLAAFHLAEKAASPLSHEEALIAALDLLRSDPEHPNAAVARLRGTPNPPSNGHQPKV